MQQVGKKIKTIIVFRLHGQQNIKKIMRDFCNGDPSCRVLGFVRGVGDCPLFWDMTLHQWLLGSDVSRPQRRVQTSGAIP